MTEASQKIAILADPEDPNLRDSLRGVGDFVRELPGWSLHGLELPCYHKILYPGEWDGDGCLIITPPQTDAAKLLQQRSKVTVTIGKLDRATASISHDIRGGLQKVLKHLAGQGCRKIILHGIKSRKLFLLLESYGQRLKLQIECPARQEVLSALSSADPPVGVLVPDCQHALEIQNLARSENLPAPIVASLGDDKNCQLSASGISSLAYPAREMGYRAARLLHHQINHPSRVRHLIFRETELHTRHSNQMEQIDDPIVREALNQIRLKVAHSPIRVNELAKSIRVSRTNLTERFQNKLGLPPADVIRRERLAIAKRRLKRPDEMVKSVALSMGFSSSQEFARFFKNATGQTPSEFVECHTNEQNEPRISKMHQI